MWGRNQLLIGHELGAAVQGQLCQRLTGSKISISTLLGSTAVVLCSSFPSENTSLEICNRALNHLTSNGSKLNQLLLLFSVLATKEKCSLFFIAIFSYSWGISSCSLWASSVLYKTQIDPSTFLLLSLFGLVGWLVGLFACVFKVIDSCGSQLISLRVGGPDLAILLQKWTDYSKWSLSRDVFAGVEGYCI